MKLYNTLTRQIEDFAPLTGNEVRIYSCGPTVYDHIHIGNLSAFITADTVRRSLQANGYTTTHVMNFTDVDDKTIRRSREEYPGLAAKEALHELTTKYGDIFLRDMELVGNDPAEYQFVKATDPKVIEGMQELIRQLQKDGFAYIADDGVYFSITAYERSGKKYGQLSEITSASTGEARISNDEYDKESAHDFALWKIQKSDEPAWAFELDGHNLDGRPGWHIECSIMSTQNAGLPFDIHTGGIDLIFPHHENEIAQSTAGRDNDLYASYFVHNEHILIDGKKMSKSLQNFYTLKDITDRGYDPLAFRLLVLQSHYRSQTHFSWDALDAAQNRLQDLRALAALQWQTQPVLHDHSTFVYPDVGVEMANMLAQDLHTEAALMYLSIVTKDALTLLVGEEERDGFVMMLQDIDAMLGLRLSGVEDITKAQKSLIADREHARMTKDWKESDRLRDELLAQGIGLRDTTYGAIWYPHRPLPPRA